MWKYSPGQSVAPSPGDSCVLGQVSKVESVSGNLEPGPGLRKTWKNQQVPKERGGRKREGKGEPVGGQGCIGHMESGGFPDV